MNKTKRDSVAKRLAENISNQLSFMGIAHFLYVPNETNHGLSVVSENQIDFDRPFEDTCNDVGGWILAIGHQSEDGNRPFGLLRWDGDDNSDPGHTVVPVNDSIKSAEIICKVIDRSIP